MSRFTMGTLSASQATMLNEMREEIRKLKGLTVAAPLSISRIAGVPVISSPSSHSILAEITANDSGTPPVHTAKRVTRDISSGTENEVIDFVPETVFEQVLNPLETTIANGTLVVLVEIADHRGWYWAVPTETGGSSHPVIKARVASTANVTLASDVEAGDTLNGVTLAEDDVILLKDQSTASENGVYVVASSGAPTRHEEADSSAELVNCIVTVAEGTTDADTIWLCTTNEPITVDTTGLTWEKVYPRHGFFARLTATSGGKWNFIRLTLNISGTFIDDGSATSGYPATPLTIDGTNLCNPVVGSRVWMKESDQSGKYEFLPFGYASATLPGLVSSASQTFGGEKTFNDDVTCSEDITVEKYALFNSDKEQSIALSDPVFEVRNYHASQNRVLISAVTARADSISDYEDCGFFEVGDTGSAPSAEQANIPAFPSTVSQNYRAAVVASGPAAFMGSIYLCDDVTSATTHYLRMYADTPDIVMEITAPGGHDMTVTLTPTATGVDSIFDVSDGGGGARYSCEGNTGLTTTRTVKDGSGTNQTVTITGGIITGWTT